MSTQKNRPVLFELVKNRVSSVATTWRAPLPAKLQAKQRAAEGEAPPPTSASPIRTGIEQASWEFLIPRFAYESAGGQIRVAMNASAAILTGLALIVLLIVAFQVGRSTVGQSTAPTRAPEVATRPTTHDKPVVATPPAPGDSGKVHTPNRPQDEPSDRRSSADPPTRREGASAKPDSGENKNPQPAVTPNAPAANAATPNVPAVNPTTPEGAKPAADVTNTPELKKGYHYLVIQHFRKTDTETADAAARFLIANGIPCAVQNMKADIRVIATDAFLIANQKDPVRKEQQGRANDLIRKVKQLGKEFAKTHGYAFDQCELRELK